MQKLKHGNRLIIILTVLLLVMGIVMPVTANAAQYTITNKGSVSDGVSRVGKFLIKGKLVFCCDHKKMTPPTGTKATASVRTNANIAKVLYYGYKGPEQWSGFKNSNAAIVATSLALDHYFNNGTGRGNPNYKAFMRFLATKDTSRSGSSYILYTTGKSRYQRLAAVNPSTDVKISVTKESADKSFTGGNASYSLKGAEYGVYSGEKLLKTLTTDNNGKASARITIDSEAVKNLTVKEIKSSPGYEKDKTVYNKDGSSGSIHITSKEPPVSNIVDILLYKADEETGKFSEQEGLKNYIPQKGSLLAGAVFKVDFYGIKESEIPADKDYSRLKPLRTWYFETNEEGNIRLNKSFLADGYGQSELYFNPLDKKTPALPLGVLTMKEVKAPKGYMLNDELYVHKITDNGSGNKTSIYKTPVVTDKIKRGDLSFSKAEAGTERKMANIPFMITALEEDGKATEKGEQHIVVTDSNGYVSTENSFHLHADKTNFNDNAWNGMKIEESKLDPSAGIWFGEKSALKAERGALPYGRYRIDELQCKHNEGYTMLKGIEIEVSKDNYNIQLQPLLNKKIELKTSVSDSTLNRKGSTIAREDTTLTDKVSYKGLEKGEQYTLDGIIMDKTTGKPLLIDDKEIKCKKTFIADNEDGFVDMMFSFDARSLKGKDIVVFESLSKNSQIIAKHEDLNDKGQTIYFVNPVIKTTAKDGETGSSNIMADDKVTIIDEVYYKGLIEGQIYEIRGTLMDKSTGKPVLINGKEITAKREFKADKSEGYVDVKFTFDAASCAGKDIVVFEEILWSGQIIAEHRDIHDISQTVSFINEEISAVQTGDNNSFILVALAIMISTGAITLGIVFRALRKHGKK